jgi:hypothetical protein
MGDAWRLQELLDDLADLRASWKSLGLIPCCGKLSLERTAILSLAVKFGDLPVAIRFRALCEGWMYEQVSAAIVPQYVGWSIQ